MLKNGHTNIKIAIKTIRNVKLGYNSHLWFLYALVVLYIFFPLLKNVWDTNVNLDDKKNKKQESYSTKNEKIVKQLKIAGIVLNKYV